MELADILKEIDDALAKLDASAQTLRKAADDIKQSVTGANTSRAQQHYENAARFV